MMEPFNLIGLPYRLGAIPERHGAGDCVTLARTVLSWHGINSPTPDRSWYRRLRKGDYSIFEEQLERWGTKSSDARVGTIGLIHCSDNSFGLATFYEDGWLQFKDRQVIWIPFSGLIPIALYCQLSGK